VAGRRFQVTVTESLEQLEKSLHHARTVRQKERLQVLMGLKQGEVNNRVDLAVRCGRDKATITRWVARYQQGGLNALLATRRAPGARRKIHPWIRQCRKLSERLGHLSDLSGEINIQH